MFQYILVLLLINTCYQSAAAPDRSVKVDSPQHPIANSLSRLATKCGNKLLIDQINSKTEECGQSDNLPFNNNQFQCLMFLDINTQLCAAAGASKITVPVNATAKLSEKQNINTFCPITIDWVFSNITEYPMYKTLSEDLKLPATCGEICGYSVIGNKDTNFYCKYFKWGLDLLKTQTSTQAEATNEGPSSSSELADIAVGAGVSASTAPPTQKPVTTKVPEVAKSTPKVIDQAQGNIPEEQEPTLKQASSKSDAEAVGDAALGDPPVPPIKTTKKTSPIEGDAKQAPAIESSLDVDKKPESVIDKVPEDTLPGETENDDEDMEPIDGDTGDGDDQKFTNLEKNSIDVPKNEYTRIDTDNEFPEDSDNFFPFFLTAIVIVILLYVLYHNKNKVSKVFFGLLVEGRGNTRRRNSRGHAYRRLDTLEQAMSANTGAPPSKIIY